MLSVYPRTSMPVLHRRWLSGTSLIILLLFVLSFATVEYGHSAPSPRHSQSSQQTTSAPAWAPVGSMSIGRANFTATLLGDGKVLALGGDNGGYGVDQYNPATGSWTTLASTLSNSRARHSATLLPNGKLLVVGGVYSAAVEIYDPGTATWSAAATLPAARGNHTATLLPDGRVLVVGGRQSSSVSAYASALLYTPATNTWTSTGSLANGREGHTATLLPSGKVLVIGGFSGSLINSAELYDPFSGTWSAAALMPESRYEHTSTLLDTGKVLVVGGQNDSSYAAAVALVYDPVANTWATSGSLATARRGHSTTRLPDGTVVVAGGYTDSIYNLASTEIYNPATGTWSAGSALATGRRYPSAVLLPGGSLLVVGGLAATPGAVTQSSAELATFTASSRTAGASLPYNLHNHTATLLPNGLVLIAGGKIKVPVYAAGAYASTGLLYDPVANTWTPTGPMVYPRERHTATLLANGKVLIAGGFNYINSGVYYAELYDPATNTWTQTGSLAIRHNYPESVLLHNGKVLLTGDWNGGTTELYDPATGTWSVVATATKPRQGHSAVVLPDGKVFVVGGQDQSTSNMVYTTEMYDPVADTWTTKAGAPSGYYDAGAVLLPNGKMMIAGGGGNTALYNPATNTWLNTSTSIPGQQITAAVLPSGQVLYCGGFYGGGTGLLNAVQLYEPATGVWSTLTSLAQGRHEHTMTVLADGSVLFAGGFDYTTNTRFDSVERYRVGAPSSPTAPQLTSVPASVTLGNTLALGGLALTANREGADGGTTSNPTAFPLVQLRSIDSGQTVWLLSSTTVPWSTSGWTSRAVSGLPAGPALVTVWSGGVAGTSRYILVQ